MQRDQLEILTSNNSRANASIRNVATLFLNAWNSRLWIAFSLVFCFAVSLLYLRYTTPQFLVTASILVRDDAKGSEFGDTAFLESLGLSSVKSSVDNEVEILKSRTLMESVVHDLQLHVRYYATGHVKTTELYDKSPFHLTLLAEHSPKGNQSTTYHLLIGKKNHYTLKCGPWFYRGIFGDTIALPHGMAILQKTPNPVSHEDQHSITIQDPELLVDQYRKAVLIAPTNKLVSTVTLSLNEVLPRKGEAILDRLLINYLKASIDEKNRTGDSTIAFINENLNQVSNELTASEKAVEDFQTTHRITDLSEHVRQLIASFQQFEQEQNKYTLQARIVNSLLLYLAEKPQHVVPAQLFVQDPGFLALIENYNAIQLTKSKDLTTIPELHPRLRSLNAQLSQLRADLIANVVSQQQDLQIGLDVMRHQKVRVQRKLDDIPKIERLLLEAKRQQQIKQDLYILLLKKQVETAISKSSTLPNARIIDKPKAGPDPTKPNKQLVMLLSGCVGIGFPLAVLHLKRILNTRILDKSELTADVNVNILAEISHKAGSVKNVYSDTQSRISEQFRVLRTNVQFLATASQSKVIILTSSMGGEGKSFIAVNLCGSLALTGKKVILLELDLRKPRIAKELRLKEEGFTDYLVTGLDLNTFKQTAGLQHPFQVITAGHLPPNPAELLLLPKVNSAIQLLKKEYDFIILDTPPIGLVTDAHLLSNLSDISLYVVRQRFTYKNQLEIVRDIQERSLLPALHLVLNDVKDEPGYDNAYGYYKPEKNQFPNFFKRLIYTT